MATLNGKQGLSLKQQRKIYLCYVRPVLLHCCETSKFSDAYEATFHRVERCMIYIYYICTYHILLHTEYVQDINSISHGV